MYTDPAFLMPAIALVIGVLSLILPKLLNYLVAIYLIAIGVIGLWPQLFDGSIKLPH